MCVLDYLGGVGVGWSCDVEGALMNVFMPQTARFEAMRGSYDPWLLGAAVALASLGVVMVASSSIELTDSPFYYLVRHLVSLSIGVCLAFG